MRCICRGIETFGILNAFGLTVFHVGDDAHGQGIVDVETVPARLYLVKVPQVTILAVSRIHVFGRFFGLAYMLLTFVEDVADFHLERETDVGLLELQHALETQPIEWRACI